ncbi:ras-related protein Rap-2a-like [Diadema antillarum]|uniref:ras-related protein Rap-2a-like n=1 Tax=Diadema antillarum TaxID=105358 RepID=UPI003A85868F
MPSLEKRVVFLGSARVGKSSVIDVLMDNTFKKSYSPTNANVHRHTVEHDGVTIKMHILDSSGKQNSYGMRNLVARSCDLFVVVYSPDFLGSYQLALKICAEITEQRGHNVPILVIANKMDLEERKIGQPEAELMFSQWNTFQKDCSAKTGKGVKDVLEKVLQLLSLKLDDLEDDESLLLHHSGDRQGRMTWRVTEGLRRTLGKVFSGQREEHL